MDDKNAKIETKYNALRFDMGRFAKPAAECFQKSQFLCEEISPMNRPYEIEEGQHSDMDLIHILSHAASALQQLSKVDLDADHLPPAYYEALAQLERDYKTFIYCLRQEGNYIDNGYFPKSYREIAREFTETMLHFDRAMVVFSVMISFFYKTAEAEQNPPPARYFPDFYDLFLRAADHELYTYQDCHNALLLYELLSLNPTYRGFTTEDREAFHFWEQHGNVYLDILHFAPVSKVRIDKRSPIPNIRFHFNCLISLEQQDSLFSLIISHLDDFFDAPIVLLDDNDRREYFLMANVLLEQYIISLLYLLSLAPEKTQKELKENVLEKRLYLYYHRQLFSYARTIRTQADYLRLLDYAAAAQISRFLLHSLSADDSADKVVYYTALDNFAFMLPDHCKDDKADRCGKLTIMHLSYMNDPNEGKMLQKALYRKLGQQPGTERTDLSVPYVFLKSFSPHLDYLPMWEMYGGKAQGCCVVLDWKKSLADSTAPEVPLYRVCYLRHANNTYHITQTDNPELNDLPQFRKWFSQLRKIARKSGIDRKIFNQLLGALLYLFKDSSYSYEREYRIIYAYPKAPSDKILLRTAQTPPKFFVQPDFHVQIDELILGPKFQDISDHTPYLQRQLEEMAEKTGKDVPKITLSNIDYR